jgi:hypothetical protein
MRARLVEAIAIHRRWLEQLISGEMTVLSRSPSIIDALRALSA